MHRHLYLELDHGGRTCHKKERRGDLSEVKELGGFIRRGGNESQPELNHFSDSES